MGQGAGRSEESTEAEGWPGWADRERVEGTCGVNGAEAEGLTCLALAVTPIPVTPRSSNVREGGSPGKHGAGPRAPEP